jgi:hypothetical protein
MATTDQLILETNIPTEVSLKYPTPREFQRNGETRCFFTLSDNRVWFLSQGEAQKVTALNPKPGEPLTVCRRELRADGKRWLALEVSAAAPTAPKPEPPRTYTNGKNGHGELAIPAPPEPQPAPQPQTGAAPQGHLHPATHSGSAQTVLQTAQVLIDITALCVQYARDRHPGMNFAANEIQDLVQSAWINYSRGGPQL